MSRPRWLNVRVVGGIVLVIAAVVVGARVIGGSSRTIGVWAADRDLAAGTVLTAQDLSTAEVNLGDNTDLYITSAATSPIGRTVVTPLRAGELLAASAVEESAAGRVVAVGVEPNNMPLYGGVVASAFGLLDESPGLAGACRSAANGRLDLSGMTALCWSLGDDLRLLTGISRADRWPEVRPSAIPAVLAVAREMAPLTIVDCAFCLEADEEITFDTMAPRRNGATLALLAEADVVFAVGSGDPPGMERLIRALTELGESLPGVTARIVLNRCRSGAASDDEAAGAVKRFADAPVAAKLPEDRGATDKAWRRGLSLAEVAPDSPLTRALRSLASSIAPVVARASS